MVYFLITLFILLLIFFWILNLIGLPGNWLIVILSLLWMIFGPEQYEITWVTIAILIGLAVLGEAIEFGTSVLGTKKMGGSSRGATLSVIGSAIGGIAGAILGLPIPIPLVGSLIGSLFFASLGAFIGAFIGEKWIGKSNPDSVKISTAAFIGRLFGTLGKLIVGSTMVVVAIIANFI